MSINVGTKISTDYQLNETKTDNKTSAILTKEKKLPVEIKKDDLKISQEIQKDSKSNPIKTISFAESASKNASMVLGNAQTAIDAVKWINSTGHATNVAVISRVTRSISPLAHVVGSAHVFQEAERNLMSKKANIALGALTLAGASFDVSRGVKQIQEKKVYEGTYNVINGTAGYVTGAALLGNNMKVATVAGIVGVSIPIAKYGSDSTKKLGWFKDSNGKNETVFENFLSKSSKVGDLVSNKTNNKTLGNLSTVGTGIVMSTAAVGVSIGGVFAGGVSDAINASEKLVQKVFK
jgi:hypothetical protein